nr:FGGY family carbohydrate kinase [Vulcanisaeta sp. JCM 14467]
MAREKRFILVVDQGTTGTRTALVSHDGSIIGYAYHEHTQIYPKPAWVEHNPIEIWEKTKLVIKEVLEYTRVDPREIAAIGVTNQRETTVIWDPRNGQPVYNAIVWQDRRTSSMVDYLKQNYLA